MKHEPVLLSECIEGLNIKPDGIYIDGTLGRGGHTRAIAGRLDSGKIIAIDRDADAIEEAGELLSEFGATIRLVHGNFKDIQMILDAEGVAAADGMLFDLGVSSTHLDDGSRGFSYMRDAPLDMRMDKSDELTAYTVVNFWPEDRLRAVFYKYGEEKHSGSIARAIVKKRAAAPIETTFGLADIIIASMPPAARREAQHPAKRCFQALRIAVNDELGSIGEMLDSAPDRLKAGGRICVISFHSLEDRLVKNAFNARTKGCVCPKDFPVCVCGVVPTLKMITKKPIIPGKDEIERNHRSRSAKLRIAERI